MSLDTKNTTVDKSLICTSYDKAKEESQVTYVEDLHALDADIRAKGQTNAPALIRSLFSLSAALAVPLEQPRRWQWSSDSLLEQLRTVKKEMAIMRQRPHADQVKGDFGVTD